MSYQQSDWKDFLGEDKVSAPWTELRGPSMPRAITEMKQIPMSLLEFLSLQPTNCANTLMPGFVARFEETQNSLFGASQVLTMWATKDKGETYSPWSPQQVFSLVPAQAVLTVVGLFDKNPMFIFQEKTRDLAIPIPITKAFWQKGLMPTAGALLPFLGVSMLEAPRGALPEGGGSLAIATEAEEELGMEAVLSMEIAYNYTDAGIIASPMPDFFAIMKADKKKMDLIDVREGLAMKGTHLVLPEDLFAVATEDRITMGQIFGWIRWTMSLTPDTETFGTTSEGEEVEVSAEYIKAIQSLAIRVLNGASNAIALNMS